MPWAPSYVTLDQFKVYKDTELTDTTDDAAMTVAIEAASRAIDKAANRQFGKTNTAENREYTAEFDTKRRRWIIEIDDTPTESISVFIDLDDDGDFESNIDSFRLFPFNAPEKGKPFELVIINPTSLVLPVGKQEGTIQINAFWGWDTVPEVIRNATFLQADRFFTRKDAPFGVAGSPDLGSEIRLLAKVDPDVKVMLRSVTRWWGAV